MFRSIQVCKAAASRGLRMLARAFEALVFKMPAMSPTMTEGGIVSWKVEPGSLFAAGDVLLEVETDKATIDVEAQDDGVMWKILTKEGATGVPVGKPIAYLAEEGDDLAALKEPETEVSEPEKPKETAKAKEEPKEEKPAAKTQTPQTAAPSKNGTQNSKDGLSKADPNQKLTPAVEFLLSVNNISHSDALAKIPASGPKGRLLKGDVLAYLGKINQDAVVKVAEYIRSKEHLDLSNIKIAPPKAAEKAAPKAEKKPTNVFRIQCKSALNGLTPAKFQYAFDKAIVTATRQTYMAKFPQYANGPTALGEEDLFASLLTAPVSQNRFAVSPAKYRFGSTPAKADAFDELLGIAAPPQKVEEAETLLVDVSFNVTLSALADSSEFFENFKDSLLTQIPAQQLVITNI